MIYDIVDTVDCAYYIFVDNLRKCIIIPTLNFISRNKSDWFKVGGFLLYLPTYWYHMAVGICRDVSVAYDRMCQ